MKTNSTLTEFADLLGIQRNKSSVIVGGHNRDLYELMNDLYTQINELADTDEEVALFTKELFELDHDITVAQAAKIRLFLNGIDFKENIPEMKKENYQFDILKAIFPSLKE